MLCLLPVIIMSSNRLFCFATGKQRKKRENWKRKSNRKAGSREQRGRNVGWQLRHASQERPLPRRNRVHPTEKLTLDTMALASSTVFFKTCFIFSFGAIREKRTDSCQTHGLFQNPGCSGTLLPEPGNLRREYESGIDKRDTDVGSQAESPARGEVCGGFYTVW